MLRVLNRFNTCRYTFKFAVFLLSESSLPNVKGMFLSIRRLERNAHGFDEPLIWPRILERALPPCVGTALLQRVYGVPEPKMNERFKPTPSKTCVVLPFLVLNDGPLYSFLLPKR